MSLNINKKDVLNLEDIRPMWNGYHGRHHASTSEEHRGVFNAQRLGQVLGFDYYTDGSRTRKDQVHQIVPLGHDAHYGPENVAAYSTLPLGPDRPEKVDDVYVTKQSFGSGYYKDAKESLGVDKWAAAFNKAVGEARRAGKYWLCFHGETGIYYAYPVLKTSTGRSPIGRMSDLPKSPPSKRYSDLLHAVSAYLAEPSRTERVRVTAELDRLGFWSARSDADRQKALHKLIGDNKFCDAGVRRFREYLGDLLPESKPLYRDRTDLTEARPIEMLVGPGASTNAWLRAVNHFLDNHKDDPYAPIARFRIPVPDED